MIETFVSDPFFNVEFGRALTATFIGVGSAILIALGVRCLDTRGRKAERTRQRLQLASALAVNVEGNRRLLTTVPGGLVPTMEENLRLAKEHRDEGTPIPASYIYFEYFNTALLDATAARKYELGLGDGLSAASRRVPRPSRQPEPAAADPVAAGVRDGARSDRPVGPGHHD